MDRKNDGPICRAEGEKAMGSKGYWVIKTEEAGLIGEKTKYWIPGEAPTRSLRKMKSDIRKLRQNENDLIRRCNRTLNANWPKSNGYLLLLTVSDESMARIAPDYRAEDPDTWDEALLIIRHEEELWLRRCARACKKAGIEFRYYGVASDLDLDPKHQIHVHTRPHLHFVVDPACVEICKAAWKLGHAGEKRLKSEIDHYDLAKYLMEQTRRTKEHEIVYTASRNLAKPKETIRMAPSDKEVQPPKGARVLHRTEYRYGRPQYIRYVIPEKKNSKKSKTKGDSEL